VAKWIARSRAGGDALLDASSRPHRSPAQLPAAMTATIVALRQRRATSWTISRATGVPRSTVTRVLAQAGLNRLRCLDPRPIVQRYEWPHAGDLLHLDIKPLARIYGVGHRIHGDRQRRHPGHGWEYAPVAIDGATRLANVEVRLASKQARSLANRTMILSSPYMDSSRMSSGASQIEVPTDRVRSYIRPLVRGIDPPGQYEHSRIAGQSWCRLHGPRLLSA